MTRSVDIQRLSRPQLVPDADRQTVVFVGGPIQHALASGGFDQSLKRLFERLLQLLEDNGFRVLSAHRLEEYGDKTACWTPDEITLRDRRWMDEADVFVAVLPSDREDGVVRTDGTHVELGWASAVGKPIIVLLAGDRFESYTHLVRGLSACSRVVVLDLNRLQEDLSPLVSEVDALLAEAPRLDAAAG